MGVRRYSRDSDVKRWQERFDELQNQCRSYDGSPTFGELRAHGIERGRWQCRNVDWRLQGPQCWHTSEPFDFARFGERLTVAGLRRNYVCSQCGRNRPFLELLPPD